MAFYINYQSPIGNLFIREQAKKLTHISFQNCAENTDIPQQTPLLAQTVHQLDEYFAGTRKVFDLPLAPQGTSFQKKIWQALTTIPYGQTESYFGIAHKIGHPKACRAVGMANHQNPIVIVIPCHRVIGKNGSLVGYGGGLTIKEFLLNLEKEN